MHIFIQVYITKDVVNSVEWKLSGSAGHGGIDLEALQGWLLKYRDDSKKLHISVEYFVDWLANQSPPWSAYKAFMYGRLLVLNKQPGIRPVTVREI